MTEAVQCDDWDVKESESAAPWPSGRVDRSPLSQPHHTERPLLSACPAGNAPAPGSRINRQPAGKNTPGVATTSQAWLKGLAARLSACLHPGAVPHELLRGAGVLRVGGEGSNPLCEYPTPHPQGKYGRHSRPSNGLAVLKPTFPKPKEKVGRAEGTGSVQHKHLSMISLSQPVPALAEPQPSAVEAQESTNGPKSDGAPAAGWGQFRGNVRASLSARRSRLEQGPSTATLCLLPSPPVRVTGACSRHSPPPGLLAGWDQFLPLWPLTLGIVICDTRSQNGGRQRFFHRTAVLVHAEFVDTSLPGRSRACAVN
jgi:hypothetical protein